MFQLAAQLLQEETDKWEEENNSIVMVAKEMAQQMLHIAKLARGRNRIQVPGAIVYSFYLGWAGTVSLSCVRTTKTGFSVIKQDLLYQDMLPFAHNTATYYVRMATCLGIGGKFFSIDFRSLVCLFWHKLNCIILLAIRSF